MNGRRVRAQRKAPAAGGAREVTAPAQIVELAETLASAVGRGQADLVRERVKVMSPSLAASVATVLAARVSGVRVLTRETSDVE